MTRSWEHYLGKRKADRADPPYVVLRQTVFEPKALKLSADTTMDMGPCPNGRYGQRKTKSFNFTKQHDEHHGNKHALSKIAASRSGHQGPAGRSD